MRPSLSTTPLYSRSENIAEKLLKSGYKNIYNLYGGIFE
jgi:rhodanese-related sulfurtransferase